jgi:hypothetical protein
MSGEMDLVELARALAAIASETKDAETGQQLLQLVDRLLTAAGLPAPRNKSDAASF